MLRILCAATSLLALAGTATAASIVNNDAQTRTVVVTDGGNQAELTLGAGERTEFCPNGCFISVAGERETLLGSETVEIEGGRIRIR